MNKWLKGQGYWCPDCQGSGYTGIMDVMEFANGERVGFPNICDACEGDGRIAATLEQILSGTTPEYPQPDTTPVIKPICVRL